MSVAFRPLWASEVTGSGIPDAAFLEAVQKDAPVDLGLGQRATDTEDHAFAVIAADPVGDKCGAVTDNTVDTDFVVGGIKGHLFDRRQQAGAPFLEFGVELLVEVGDLAGGDLEAAHLLHNPGDTTSAAPPSTYIVAKADLRARSLREPFSSNDV